MMPSRKMSPDAGTEATPANDALAAGNHMDRSVALAAQKPVQARMQETLHGAMQLIARLCDRQISDAERTNCAFRARSSLRLLEKMMGELPEPLAAAPVRRQPVLKFPEDA